MNKTGMLAWAYFFPERKLYRQHARFIAARKQKKPPHRWLTQQLPYKWNPPDDGKEDDWVFLGQLKDCDMYLEPKMSNVCL